MEEFFRFISTIAISRLSSLKQFGIGKCELHVEGDAKLRSVEKNKRIGENSTIENVKDDIRTDSSADFVSCVCSCKYNHDQRNMGDTKTVAVGHCTGACNSDSASCHSMCKESSSRHYPVQGSEEGSFGGITSNPICSEETSCESINGDLLDSEPTKTDACRDRPWGCSSSFKMDGFRGVSFKRSVINQNKWQILFDLQRIEYVLSRMLEKAEFSSIDFREYSPCPEELLFTLSQVLEK